MYVIFITVVSAQLCLAGVHEIKSYKDYKVIEVAGEEDNLNRFFKFIYENHVSFCCIYLTQLNYYPLRKVLLTV